MPAEIREKLKSSDVGAGGASGSGISHTMDSKAHTLELDEDDMLSDLMESDTEVGRVRVRVRNVIVQRDLLLFYFYVLQIA